MLHDPLVVVRRFVVEEEEKGFAFDIPSWNASIDCGMGDDKTRQDPCWTCHPLMLSSSSEQS